MKEKFVIGNKNEEAIEELLSKLKAKGLSDNTVIANKRNLRSFFGRANKDYDKLTEKDIDVVLGEYRFNTKENVKLALRKFLKYHDLNELAETIELMGKNMTKAVKGRESVLDPDEIKRLIDAPNNLRDKALIEIFLTTGAELKAIQGLNIEDIEIKSDIIWVNIRYGKESHEKRNKRRVPIIPNEDNPVAIYPKNLVKWIQFRDDAKPSDPLWISNAPQAKGGKMSKEGIADIIRSYKDRANIEKKLTPHIFRHTSATYDGARLNEMMMCKKYGWSLGSPMARRYCRPDEEALVNQMMKQAGLKEEEIKKGKTCPRCGEVNNFNADICSKCSQLLDTKDLFDRLQKEEDERVLQYKKIQELQKQINKLNKGMESISKFFDGLPIEVHKDGKIIRKGVLRTEVKKKSKS